ncbi:hypothetical protein L195_g047142 [Trifolium pratense]|uniref:DUF4283 domain-containing protein n=1 Tax=Trifolium pratense TaxID=57577 RepID=A0A2K3MJN6_TRIPR|nr:hypothetical protein L195_g047142 [Trifolium pratense]
MANVNLEDLSIHAEEEEEGFIFDMEEEGVNKWTLGRGVKIKEAKTGLFLFQFAHAIDMEEVLQGGPWMFDNHMLIMERIQLGVQIENIPLYHVDFWVQVHNLPVGLMAEKVGTKLANYIGAFVEYDKNNNSSFWRQYMRLRVRVDVRQPLKKDSRVDHRGRFILAGTYLINGRLNTLEGEAMALKEAICEVKQRSVSHVVFESDSKVVVDAISSRQLGTSEFSVVISHIKSLLVSCPNFEVKFVKRQANMVARSLARAAYSLSSRGIFESAPRCIDNYLINEMS